jgi:hypothetical protein
MKSPVYQTQPLRIFARQAFYYEGNSDKLPLQ